MQQWNLENLLLNGTSAKKLYHDYAAGMPIYDYHNHLNAGDVAANRRFGNLTELWLEGDHYKWRAMRWLGIDEFLITGESDDFTKFKAWAGAVPRLAAADFSRYMEELGNRAEMRISDYDGLILALNRQMEKFHEVGCRLSDHGFGEFSYEAATEREVRTIFAKAMQGESLNASEEGKYRTFTLLRLSEMYHSRDWAMQLHIGAIRNNNERMTSLLGKNSGFDSILDYHLAASLNAFLNELDKVDRLPKTIVYSLYPYHYELIATTIGNFQSGDVPGKLQLGAAWWFHDQKEGMLQQLKALSSVGVLSTFVGMLTDSRSFMSFPRHEYFRRVLCRLLGQWIDEGELPADYDYIGGMVQDICFGNAQRYFGIPDNRA
ncbi:glucuronate isomerase [Fontibacillus phaseoli]|uniref:Uronate isomerase n=1 Tax=Fontibacillus phaseoli TaxID=1416533 RepID=A0A369BAN9_9BACL|nr:glucuronate isomerase [Fontibacillus phaseoli]RCX16744.1 glucuronate isomerase [Fontibacillus phaseoli]